MPLSIHYSVIYYICFRKDATDTNKLNKVFAQYTLLQTNTGAPRYNTVIVQEYKQANNSLHNNKVGRLYLLLTIQNTRQLDSKGKYLKYTSILVETLQVCNSGKINTKTKILKVQNTKPFNSRIKHTLNTLQIYNINYIIRPISLILTNINVIDCFFINNYSNQDIYNTIYNKDFKRINRVQVNIYTKKQAYTRW